MSKSLREIGEIAASWWVSVLEKPKFDNGDTGVSGALGMTMASMLMKPVEKQSLEVFAEKMARMVEIRLAENPRRFDFYVDYAPDGNLRGLAEVAGIPIDNFPIKTSMVMSENHVDVRYGYSADVQILYANKKYWQNQIESAKSAIVRYQDKSEFSRMDDEARKESIAFYKSKVDEYTANMENAELLEGR